MAVSTTSHRSAQELSASRNVVKCSTCGSLRWRLKVTHSGSSKCAGASSREQLPLHRLLRAPVGHKQMEWLHGTNHVWTTVAIAGVTTKDEFCWNIGIGTSEHPGFGHAQRCSQSRPSLQRAFGKQPAEGPCERAREAAAQLLHSITRCCNLLATANQALSQPLNCHSSGPVKSMAKLYQAGTSIFQRHAA